MAQADKSQRDGANGPHAWTRMHFWQIQSVRDLLFIAAVLGLIWAGYAMRSVTVPLLVALTLAYLFEPLIARMTRNPSSSRPLVVGGLLLTVGLSVVLLFSIFVPLVIGQSVRLADNLRQGRFQKTLLSAKELVPEAYRTEYEKALQWLGPPVEGEPDHAEAPSAVASTSPAASEPANLDEPRIRQMIREEFAAQSQEQALAQSADSGVFSLQKLAKGSAQTVFMVLGAVVQLGLLAFLIPFYFYFFSVSYPAVIRFGRSLLPVSNRGRTLDLIGKMDRAVAGFVRGRIVIAGITAVMLTIGWMICGVPYSLVLGLIVGVFFSVPYLSVIGLPLAVGFLALEQLALPADQRLSWWVVLIAPSAVFIVVTVVESYVLTPLICGKATNLDPVSILVAVLAGGSVGGIYGMFLAIPLAACGKILITEIVLPGVKQWTHGKADDPLPIARE